mmetsp:Transcript_96037/g.299069  ORF Transcript_96037/g.299069 Transcript_96037/m.299069 type:complete len:348 (-) Transcript_96037:47-1090(-)
MGASVDELKGQPAPPSWKVWAVPAALTLAAMIYGSWAVIAKAALAQAGVSPLILAFYRVLGGTTLMALMHKTLEASPLQRSILQAPLEDKLRFFGLGLLLSMNVGGNILALKSLSPITVAIFQPMLPVIAGLAAAVLGIEELSRLKVLGILCATSGAILVVILGHAAHGHTTVVGGSGLGRGIPCLLVNVVGGAMYCVFQKDVLRRYPPIGTATAAFAVAGCIIFIGAVSMEGFDSWAWRLAASRRAFLALLYSIFLTTALNYSLLAWANKQSTPTTVASFQTLQPICAAVLAYIFLHEVLSWGQLGGGLAILVGLGCFLLSKPVDASPPEEEPLVFAAAKKDLEGI